MLHDEVVRRTARESGVQLVHPLLAEADFDGVHDGDLLVEDDVAVVRHAAGDFVQALEQVDVVVVHADVLDVVGDLDLHSVLHSYK